MRRKITELGKRLSLFIESIKDKDRCWWEAFHLPDKRGICLRCDIKVLDHATASPLLISESRRSSNNLLSAGAIVLALLMIIIMTGCGLKPEQKFIKESIEQCEDACYEQSFNDFSYDYYSQVFTCYCRHYNQHWPTVIFQKRFTAK